MHTITALMCSGLVYSTAYSGIILLMRPANERRRYNVTSSLIGWAHAQNDPCLLLADVADIPWDYFK